MRWVFTELEKNGLPFSFVSNLRAVRCSPLSGGISWSVWKTS